MKPWLRRGLGILVTVCSMQAGAQSIAAPTDATPSPIPYRRETVTTTELSWRVGFGLLLCAALAGGAVYVLRRRFPSLAPVRTAPQLQLVETKRLDAKHTLFVVNWQDSQLLLGAGESGLTLLARHPDYRAPATERARGES